MAFIIENIRLRELAIVSNSNKAIFDDFVSYLQSCDYESLHHFVLSTDSAKAKRVLLQYLIRPLPDGIALYDGIARPYRPDKAKWLLLGWIFRDAPEQRLRPMLSSVAGNSLDQKKVNLFNEIRRHSASIFPNPESWEWTSIFEVIIDRLEGSRRAIKGTLFEAIVRTKLEELFKLNALDLAVHQTEVRIQGETYDVKVTGDSGMILMPVKTRETMGGGHAGLFTRDIHKSISVAHHAGYECIPVIIAESWIGDISGLASKRSIYIDKNPNQVAEVGPVLELELAKHIDAFKGIV